MSPGRRPQRSCIGCRKVLDQALLVRYVLSPQGEIAVDYGRKLPGRGVYTCIEKSCIESAVKRQQFDRAFKGRNQAPQSATLLAAVSEQVERRILNLLGMARKAGAVISGSRAVEAELARSGLVGLVLLGTDLSPAIAAKISGLATARGVAHFALFDKQLLGRVLGKGQRSVAAIASGPLADTIKNEISRYMHIAGEV